MLKANCLTLSTRQSARQVLGNTEMGTCFDFPSNLAFHDLAGEQTIPRAAKSVLGLSGKFVETPKEPASRKN